ncbi:Ig-like domain-containing protein [Microcella daejeonensis]|uniref:Ig-like domain-containing protein n=1 Tax=Microcella daejeonensis TaxID=2994971 RepID=A0A9E8MJZ4_9MICO|nr:Ig-like domain-containing protein [Microcella daejeonensis]WAB80965.1 Ig-like domain-containing protein [Microcella daejeonensis]
MGFRDWFARHRSAAVSGIGGGTALAVLTTLAIVAPGFQAERLDLNDGSVWVANGERQAVGRANLQLGSLDTVVPGEGSSLAVVQDETDVVVVDAVNATADIVDAALAEVSDTVPLPPDSPSLMMLDETAVVHSGGTGETWLVPRTLLTDFDSFSAAPFVFGEGSAVVMDARLGLIAAAPGTAEVLRIRLDAPDRVAERWPLPVEPDEPVAVTTAGDRWAVLSLRTAVLHTAEGAVDLSGFIDAPSEAVLAAPGGDELLIAHPGGLIAVDADGGATVVAEGRDGRPAAPALVDGCVLAAWSDGAAWRQCEGQQAVLLELAGMAANAELAVAARGGRAVLNDTRSGSAWAVQADGALIDNWDELLVEEEDEQQAQLDELDTPPELEVAPQPPVAVDDEFGARPGRVSPLPVLLNDSDPNGDVLVISAVEPVDPAFGRVDVVGAGQQLQIELAGSASGTASFAYTITDGRGGSDSAVVTVTARAAGENGPPVQVRTAKTLVAEGGTVTAAVLAEWVDPDGDPLYLADAAIAAPDVVTFRADGRVTVREAGGAGELRPVSLTVSDGALSGAGSLAVTVQPVGQTPIITEPFAVSAYAGEEVRIDPLVHVRGGSGPIRLSAVPPKQGSTITPSLDRGIFRFVSDEVRTHYLEYVVTDNEVTATGVVRVDVLPPPETGAGPITVPKTAFVRTLSSTTVAVATADIDPAGGVLVVTGISSVPPASGIRAEILEQRDIRISLTRPLDGPTDVRYRISNGVAEAEGTITVIEIPPLDRLQPPIARDDAITVRVGDAVSIPVLDNDEHPDDEPLTLSPVLPQGLEGDSGLLFVAGDRLRYLAPDQPGEYTAVYEITGPLGLERAQATVRISVREVSVDTNSAPVPRTVTARVIAGETVRIRIPVEGMDPDGDSVQIIGQQTAPERGTVTEVTADTIVYTAGEYAAGTDEFRYTVVDALGARATGLVRVGISPRLDGARNPVANDDLVVVRPGVAVLVPVLENDTDPDGSALRVSAVESSDPTAAAAVVDEEFVRVVPPEGTGRYGFVYTIVSEAGGASQAFLTVDVVEDAPLTPPVARDVVLTLADVLDRETIDVDVLSQVFFAEGEIAELGLGIVPGYDGETARILPNRSIRVTVGEQRQIIPFELRHPVDPSVRAYAFIWVPGTDDALPQLDRRARPISVVSEETVEIDINDHVIAVGDDGVRLTDTATVRATNADGSSLVVDEDTLRFTSADLYFGPASISFEVTDGTSATDPEGRVATIVLPIEVTPRENQPPALIGATIELEPGGEREIDLLRVTSYPYPDDLEELVYSVLAGPQAGLEVQLRGQTLIVSVPPGTARGTIASVTLGVRDDAAVGTSGRVTVTVVPSTRPLPNPAADSAIAPRGETTTVDVLQNDQAGNPFPDEPLRVEAIRGIDGGSLPAGVRVVPSDDGQRLEVTVSSTAAPVDTNLQYQVSDATRDPDRYVWASVRISVQDVPDAVTGLRVQGYGDRELEVAWQPGGSNNAPIEGFVARVVRVSDGAQTAEVDCAFSPCTVPTPGNGSENAVRISVVALNAQGESAPTTLAERVWSDLVPPAPVISRITPLDGGLRVAFRKPAQEASASPITSYVVTVGPVVREVRALASDPEGTDYVIAVRDGALENGTNYGVSVSARNDSFGPLTRWNSAEGSGTPAGAPLVVGAVSAVGSRDTTGDTGHRVDVAWPSVFAGNGQAVQYYYVWVSAGGTAPACTVTGVEDGAPQPVQPPGTTRVDGATSTTVSGLAADTEYRVVVYAYNGQGCTAAVEVRATPRPVPGAVTEVDVAAPPRQAGPNDIGPWNPTLRSVAVEGGGRIDSVQYRLIADGSTRGESGLVTLPAALTTADRSHYGAALALEVRACRQYETLLCGAWSGPFALPAAVEIDAAPAAEFTETSPDVRAVVITWSPVRGAAYDLVEQICRGGAVVSIDTDAGRCEMTLSTGQVPELLIRVREGGAEYDRVYRW